MQRTSKRIIPFLLAVVVIVLINVASTTLFTRADLTKNQVYSLSEASKEAVATLEEPLTIKAFFSPNLPAPYNNTEQTLRDLLEEYAIAGNRFFNYDFVTVPSGSDTGGEISAEEEEARRYSIYPIQIQDVQQDEVKLQTAYMGLAVIHGDMLETIPAVTSSASLEYQITSIIDDMSDKISALLSMRENIDVTLVLSENLFAVNDALKTLPEDLEASVQQLNTEYYGRLDFEHIDPITQGNIDPQAEYGAAPLSLRNETGQSEQAFASVLVERGEQRYTIDIITRGIFGAQIADVQSISDTVSSVADSLIGIQEEVGYLTGYGTPSLQGATQQQSAMDPIEADLANLNATVSSEYRFREIDLDAERIPDGLNTLMIVSPRERLSDYALFQIDQFLIRGGNLLLFLDSHSILMSQTNQYGQAEPVYVPRDTGLEELISHYGLELEQAYVLDEKSFVQRQRGAQGGVQEIDVYFAPVIGLEQRNGDLGFLRDLPDMVALNMSPVRLNEGVADTDAAKLLFSSSKDGWTMAGDGINLTNPFYLNPPPDEDQESIPMAWLVEDAFESFFSDRDIPAPPESQTQTGETGETSESADVLGQVDVLDTRIDSGAGRLVVVGGSAMIGSNVVDAEGQNGNARFVLNTLDYLADREAYAIMRTKGESYAPLEETTPSLRSFIKVFNIAGLPVLVVLVGLAVWFARSARKRSIESLFSANHASDQSGGTHE